MKALILLLFSVSTLLIVPETQAADKGSKKPKRAGNRDPIFALLDANSDGFLTPAELQNADSILQKLDKDDDGNLTHKEVAPAKQGKDKRRKG